jgi:hypothetical protein
VQRTSPPGVVGEALELGSRRRTSLVDEDAVAFVAGVASARLGSVPIARQEALRSRVGLLVERVIDVTLRAREALAAEDDCEQKPLLVSMILRSDKQAVRTAVLGSLAATDVEAGFDGRNVPVPTGDVGVVLALLVDVPIVVRDDGRARPLAEPSGLLSSDETDSSKTGVLDWDGVDGGEAGESEESGD